MGHSGDLLPPTHSALLREEKIGTAEARSGWQPNRWSLYRSLTLRILILNWRDARHPRAGGAEFHTHELARHLIRSGCEVEWFTASFPGAPASEIVDGVRIVRRGRQWSVHLEALRHYRGGLRGRFDAVIDEVNTIPFFTPLWAGIPTFMMIWQLAREVWWYESPFPLNAIGYFLEPLYLRVYRDTPVLTYSSSTEADLRGLGFRANITVVPVGIEHVEVPDTPKTPGASFVYVGRLSPSKRVHEIIDAFARFRRQMSVGHLALIGQGSAGYVARLRRLSEKLGVSDSVEFCGWLTGAEKHRRMAAAHALLMASAREGWGLVVTECNACGTPAVVYDVPGLRDSVRNLETGLVVRPSPRHLADGMVRLITDVRLSDELREGALRWSQTFTYEAGAKLVGARVSSLLSSNTPHVSSARYSA